MFVNEVVLLARCVSGGTFAVPVPDRLTSCLTSYWKSRQCGNSSNLAALPPFILPFAGRHVFLAGETCIPPPSPNTGSSLSQTCCSAKQRLQGQKIQLPSRSTSERVTSSPPLCPCSVWVTFGLIWSFSSLLVF